MNAYIRKVFPHDEDHEVSLTTDVFSEFFENQHRMQFVNAAGETGVVTVNNATDLRFGGDFRRFCGDIHRNDFIVIIKHRADYQLSVIRRGDDGYDFCGSFYANPTDRHAIITLDDAPLQDDTQTADETDFDEQREQEVPEIEKNVDFFQVIFYGAPGTGKSHKIDYDLFKDQNGNPRNQGLKEVPNDLKFRTTFHPDYDYAQFVGAYKPTKDSDNRSTITYEFVPQIFSKAYVKAWIEYIKALNANNESGARNVYLVIEEINRGNCAQIFGDIFQLLDRKEGHSDYPIDIDADFAGYIETQLAKISEEDGSNYLADYKSKIKEWDSLRRGGDAAEGDFLKIALPPNFNIVATMNTSDQSLFPMDSAFKRRFDWQYVPINDNHPKAHFAIEIGTEHYDWLGFLKKINDNISDTNKSEDKQIGEFFVNPKDGIIKFDEFRSKVLFYLWDSIYKDEMENPDATVFHFKKESGEEVKLTFQKLFDDNDNDRQGYVKTIIDHLGVPLST